MGGTEAAHKADKEGLCMSVQRMSAGVADRTPMTAGREFARRFCNQVCELRLHTGIHQRTERLMREFAEQHPNICAMYLSRTVDESYFSDGSCGWEAGARSKLHGLAIEDNVLFEFLAFAHGLRMHATPLDTIVHVEELWLEPAPDQPFVLRVSLYHNFPATTILLAPDGDSQEAAEAFVRRVKYLRGF
jgi:hypothetical protein